MAVAGDLRFHAEAYGLAERHGLLDQPEVVDHQRHLPTWYADLLQPDGLAALERALGVTVPASLAEFWSLERLVCGLDLIGDMAYLSHALFHGQEVSFFEGTTYLEFAMHGHSGGSAVVAVAGDDPDPLVLHGFYDPVPTEATGLRLSSYILSAVRGGLGRPVVRRGRYWAYQVRLVPRPGGPDEDVTVIAAAGTPVRDQVARQFPGRAILAIRPERREF